MSLRFALAVSWGALAVVLGCAQGSALSSNGGDGGSGASGGDGGAGATGGQGAGPLGGSAGEGPGPGPGPGGSGGSGAGTPCDESPCKLTSPQCGCASGEKCTLDNAGDRLCVEDGTAAPNAMCDANQDCAAGAICLGEAALGYCAPFCDQDSECDGTNICAVQLGDGSGGTIPNVTMCSSSCNLANASGCPSGLGCVLGQESAGQQRFFTMCFAAGNATSGSCANPGVCAPGYGCYNDGTSDVCIQNCNVNAPICASGTCLAINDGNGQPVVVNGFALGACVN
jgi:hypothetical protein